jgi:hypothetical protein
VRVGLSVIYRGSGVGSGVLRAFSFSIPESAVKFSKGVSEKLLSVKFRIDLSDCWPDVVLLSLMFPTRFVDNTRAERRVCPFLEKFEYVRVNRYDEFVLEDPIVGYALSWVDLQLVPALDRAFSE